MKKNRANVALTSVVLILTLFCSWWFFGIFTPYNYFTAKNDISKGEIKILTFGEPALNPDLELEICQKYGFRYENLGCVIYPQKVNSADCYNKVVNEYLEKRNGKFWKEKLNKDLEKIIGK